MYKVNIFLIFVMVVNCSILFSQHKLKNHRNNNELTIKVENFFVTNKIFDSTEKNMGNRYIIDYLGQQILNKTKYNYYQFAETSNPTPLYILKIAQNQSKKSTVYGKLENVEFEMIELRKEFEKNKVSHFFRSKIYEILIFNLNMKASNSFK
jgi:hypothetical protein